MAVAFNGTEHYIGHVFIRLFMDPDELSARLPDIVEGMLLKPENGPGEGWPEVLKTVSSTWFAVPEEAYFILAVVSEGEVDRIKELRAKGMAPFPGLISPSGIENTAFNLDGQRDVLMRDCEAENVYSFHLGSDAAVIVENHRQSLETPELGSYEYHVELAYLLSYGEEVTPDTVLEHLEDLVALSISLWGDDYEEGEGNMGED